VQQAVVAVAEPVPASAPMPAGARRAVKDAVERVLALLLLVLTLPLLLLAALLVKLGDGGPVLYRQTRVGRGGSTFGMWKLRTMRRDATLAEHSAPPDAPLDVDRDKLRRDPRVTRAGRLLRRSSIDELPQLLNVLSGSMSLVGPRPLLPEEVARFGEPAHGRLAVKPGITGLWQVSGRCHLSWQEQLRLDAEYVEGWSLRRDWVIMLRTVVAVVTARGAW
jgi:lipopolysaccharide/colanic/teichoic acid biosynthesis glycosyltransferase